MSEAASWINTILLLVVLWYQWNRNKTLSESMDQQTKLLQDTKSVVTQQVTALESQAKVVETAVRYSEAFDPAKMEAVLRKQVEVDSWEKIVSLEKEYKKGLLDQDEKRKEQFLAQADAAINAARSYIDPLLGVVIGLMVRVAAKERDALISELPDSKIKNRLKEAASKIDDEYRKALARG